MTSPAPVQSPFKGSCLSHIASLAAGFASSLEGFTNPTQMELNLVQFLSQLLTQHLQSMLPPAPVVPAVEPVEAAPVAEVQV